MATKTSKATKTSNVIRVPKPAKGSFSLDRPLSKNTLLKSQVEHFQKMEATLPARRRSGHAPEAILTEGHAAEYLKKMTAIFHPEGVKGAKKPKVRKAGGK